MLQIHQNILKEKKTFSKIIYSYSIHPFLLLLSPFEYYIHKNCFGKKKNALEHINYIV